MSSFDEFLATVPEPQRRSASGVATIWSYRMEELVVVDVVATEPEAELLCSLLRSSGIRCMRRLTNRGAGAFEGVPGGGPQEVLVRKEDLQPAREVLRER
jgi:hypothetical protein